MSAGRLHNRMQRRIGLLGGSFNPPHAGHREISSLAAGRLDLDAVWWLVTTGNPLKDPSANMPLEDRIAQARSLCAGCPVRVCDFEKRFDTCFTVDVLENLLPMYPDTAFVWLMGADCLETARLWKGWRNITGLVPMAVFNRPGYEGSVSAAVSTGVLSRAGHLEERHAPDLLSAPLPAWVFISGMHNTLSSTRIRNAGPGKGERNG